MIQQNAYIKAIEYYLPKETLTNEQLADIYPEWTAEKIRSKTGINIRHVAGADETALDLAEQACKKLFEKTVLRVEDVDFIILLTESPDYKLPPSACILQSRLGLPQSIGAFDINLGCSAYIYGLSVAKGLIYAGIARNILLVTTETYSKYIHPMDKSTRTLFGDGAAATWVSNEGQIGIGQFDLHTDGSGADKLIVHAGMARMPSSEETKIEKTDENGYVRSKEHLYMDGVGIFNFTIDAVPKTVNALLTKYGMAIDNVGLYVFHQANAYMLSYLQKKLKISAESFYVNLSEVGNTVSSTIPIAIRDAIDEGRFSESGRVMLVGFGVGLSWGSVMLEINNTIKDGGV